MSYTTTIDSRQSKLKSKADDLLFIRNALSNHPHQPSTHPVKFHRSNTSKRKVVSPANQNGQKGLKWGHIKRKGYIAGKKVQ